MPSRAIALQAAFSSALIDNSGGSSAGVVPGAEFHVNRSHLLGANHVAGGRCRHRLVGREGGGVNAVGTIDQNFSGYL